MYLSEKQKKRLENKKRKLIALVNLFKLNDKDKEQHQKPNMAEHSANESKKSQKLNVVAEGIEEPAPKRPRAADPGELTSTDDNDTLEIIKPENLTMTDYIKLKQELHERKIFLTRLPRIRIRDDGLKATIEVPSQNRIPLFMKDIQHMLAYFLFGPYLKPYNSSPRWCLIEKFNRIGNVTLIVFEGLSLDDYLENEDKFPFLKQYSIKVEFISPFSYEGDVVTDISAVLLCDTDKASLWKKFGNKEEDSKKSTEVFQLYKPAFPIQSTAVSNDTIVPDKFPRTFLLLSLWQMDVEKYPVPIKGELEERYANYRFTKDVYKEVSADSPFYGMDCEMCLTSINQNELTRITVVNEKSEVVYDSLVKPYNPIINYLTRYSGITEKMLQDVDKRLEDVQNDLIELLPPDAILVGHSLNADLHALKMMHPYVIDTSVIFNMSGERWRKPKLSSLALKYLGLEIQNNARGHDSAEDSIASLKLVQLKLSHDISFGDAVMAGKQHLTDRGVNPGNSESEPRNEPTSATSIFNSLIHDSKPSFVLSTEDIVERYRKFVTSDSDTEYCQLLGLSSKKRVMKRSCNAINESKFTLIHIPCLEDESNDEHVTKVDKWCSKLWKCAKDNSVSIVLFTGSQKTPSSNGVCLVEIKKPFVATRNRCEKAD